MRCEGSTFQKKKSPSKTGCEGNTFQKEIPTEDVPLRDKRKGFVLFMRGKIIHQFGNKALQCLV